MTALTNRVAAMVLCAAAACCSCQRRKPPAPVMVPPSITVQVPAKPPPQPPPPPDLPPSQTATTVAPPPTTTEEMPGPPKRKRKTTKKTRKEPSAPQSADVQPAATVQTPPAQDGATPPVPRLGQMLSDDQRRDYETHIHDALERARAVLGRARANTKLTEAQQRMATQVETFVEQAEDRRKTDLVSARSLAERADLLARDLAESLR